MNDAIRAAVDEQRRAADPRHSIVLEASAGSGKTKVLVDRFLRLCLSGPGVDPRAVLAITFTRKATVEIVQRLQREASRLAVLATAELREALQEILGPDHTVTDAEMARAAWFHESLLDDPAGLGIDTLHAFCQKVLARFAAEVGLDPRFTVLDDRQETDYRAAALDALELELASDPELSGRYVNLGGTVIGSRLQIADLFARRVHLQRWLDRVAPPPETGSVSLSRPQTTAAPALMADLQRAALDGTPWAHGDNPSPSDLAPDLAQALRTFADVGLAAVEAVDAPLGFTVAFEKRRDELRQAALTSAAELAADPSLVPPVLAALGKLLLTTTGSVRKLSGRKPTASERHEALCSAVTPLLVFMQLLDLQALLQNNHTRLRCGLRALDLYAELKRRDRVVDFQDLEYLALRLLTDAELSPHIHYRLDARLDHLLLDEFQDTNLNQWQMLRPLLLELLSAADPPRTVFVVGDVKQSIYGFRGAEPLVFGLARDLIQSAAGEDALKRLPTNFRTLPRLVSAVGDVCEGEPVRGYLGPEAEHARQEIARREWDGQVLLVPGFPADDQASGHDHAAAAVVELIRKLHAESAGDGTPGPVRLDDILILSRTKSHLASYEAALRRAGIPFTPAGRGLLARSREVQDVLALLRWLTVPADDTAGATVLRSPAFRLSEATVQDLLSRRTSARRRSLREVLRQDAADLGLESCSECLEGWFRAVGLMPLHDLLRRIFREGDLPARVEIAGGEQARFNLLRLVDLALAADQRGGSLRDFVHELEQADRLGGEDEGALPGEAGAGRVRVMTVHGSKGLEAPVVILVDAAVPLNDDTEHLLLSADQADGPWLAGASRSLTDPGDDGPAGLLADHRRRALARLRAEEAHILYVALTRARDRLYVLGGRNRKQGPAQDERSYLGWLREAAPADLWIDHAAWAKKMPSSTVADGVAAEALADRQDDVRHRTRAWTPPPLAPRVVVDTPSHLDDDHPRTSADDGDDPPPLAPRRRETDATRRGTRLHLWLERAGRLGAMPPPPTDPDLRAEWEEARATFEHPDLRWVFTAGRGLCEAPVIGADENSQHRTFGIIDRLVVRPERVDIVDFKSNRIVPGQIPDLVEHYRPQLAAYHRVLSRLYPGRELRSWLLWTHLAAAGQSDCLTEVTP